MKRFLLSKSILLLILLVLFVLLFCSGCQMSPQERNGVSLLPQNRPSTSSMRNPAFGGVGFTY